MRAAHTYRGARRNVARAAGMPFQPRVGPYLTTRRTIFDNFGRKVEPRALAYRHIIRTEKRNGREYQLHATKGWRSYVA